MSSTDSTADFDALRFDFVVSVSILGTACGLLACSIVGLIAWNYSLSRKIKKLDPFVNFKLQRPKLTNEEIPDLSTRPSNTFVNPGYVRNPLGQTETHRDLNPIALRSKASFDNGNFSFGTPNNNKLSTNSFRSPDYLDLDSKFY